MGSIDMQKLKADGFSIEDMDLNKKGYLNIEDLVCFINLYSGNFYRNREVSTTYRRLGKLESNKTANGIQYQTFLSALTRQ